MSSSETAGGSVGQPTAGNEHDELCPMLGYPWPEVREVHFDASIPWPHKCACGYSAKVIHLPSSPAGVGGSA